MRCATAQRPEVVSLNVGMHLQRVDDAHIEDNITKKIIGTTMNSLKKSIE